MTIGADHSAARPGAILGQLRHDARTIALLLVVPALPADAARTLFDGHAGDFDRVGLIMLGVFPFVIMFLITSIAMLRERTTGTLERLLTTPMRKLDLLFGYGIAFGVAAAVQAAVAVGVAYWLLGLDTPAARSGRGRSRSANAVLGVALGLFAAPSPAPSSRPCSSCRWSWCRRCSCVDCSSPRGQMAGWLQAISDVLPDDVRGRGAAGGRRSTRTRPPHVARSRHHRGCVVVALILAAATLRRRTP